MNASALQAGPHNSETLRCDGQFHYEGITARRCPGPVSSDQRRIQGALFGDRLKERALRRAECEHADDLEAARLIRDRLAIEHGTVDADMVREVFERYRGANVWSHWTGALFRDGKYEPVGFKASVYPTNHSALIRVWRRKR